MPPPSAPDPGGRSRPVAGEPFGLAPEEVAARLRRGEDLLLVDVREAEELALARLEGAAHAPLSTLHRHGLPLREGAVTVVLCHHGVRSAHVVTHLRRAGVPRVYNLEGGIDAWARRVDAAVGRY